MTAFTAPSLNVGQSTRAHFHGADQNGGPFDAGVPTVAFDNAAVASYTDAGNAADRGGNFTALAVGTATATLTFANGVTDTVAITVAAPAALATVSISFDPPA